MKKIKHIFKNKTELKYCSKCKKYLSLLNFGSNTSTWDNLEGWCKNCRKEDNKYSTNYKYNTYVRSARHRGLKFSITKKEFIELISHPCCYCGELQDGYNGIDRVDSKQGYVIKNCASCCSICNRMKSIYTKEIFIKQCKKITERVKDI